MVEFKQIRFYCLFTNSFAAQTSPKHVCAEPSSCHSIACITSPKCSLLSAFHLIMSASSPAPSFALVDPSQPYTLPQLSPSKCKWRTNIMYSSTCRVLFLYFASLLSNCFHSPTSPPPVYMHVPSISYVPQNTDHVSLQVHVMHFTRRLQPWLHQGFYSSALQIINIFINTAKSVPLEVLHR